MGSDMENEFVKNLKLTNVRIKGKIEEQEVESDEENFIHLPRQDIF